MKRSNSKKDDFDEPTATEPEMGHIWRPHGAVFMVQLDAVPCNQVILVATTALKGYWWKVTEVFGGSSSFIIHGEDAKCRPKSTVLNGMRIMIRST